MIVMARFWRLLPIAGFLIVAGLSPQVAAETDFTGMTDVELLLRQNHSVAQAEWNRRSANYTPQHIRTIQTEVLALRAGNW